MGKNDNVREKMGMRFLISGRTKQAIKKNVKRVKTDQEILDKIIDDVFAIPMPDKINKQFPVTFLGDKANADNSGTSGTERNIDSGTGE